MLYILQAKLAVTLIQKRLHGQASHYLHSSTSTDNGHLHHINPYHVCPRTSQIFLQPPQHNSWLSLAMEKSATKILSMSVWLHNGLLWD